MSMIRFGAGSYSVDPTVFQGPDLIENDKQRKQVEQAFEKHRPTLDALHDSFKLEYSLHRAKLPSADPLSPDYVKISFTMPDGKPAQEEVNRSFFSVSYASLAKKAVNRALALSNYFHPKKEVPKKEVKD